MGFNTTRRRGDLTIWISFLTLCGVSSSIYSEQFEPILKGFVEPTYGGPVATRSSGGGG